MLEVWNQDRSRPHSYRPAALASSAKLSVLRRAIATISLHPDLPHRDAIRPSPATRPQERHITDPSPCAILPLRPKSLLCSFAAVVDQSASFAVSTEALERALKSISSAWIEADELNTLRGGAGVFGEEGYGGSVREKLEDSVEWG
jgi:hypothetical protein